MRGRFDFGLECYIGGGFWQQVLDPGGEIGQPDKLSFEPWPAAAGSRLFHPSAANRRGPEPGRHATLRIRRPARANRAIVAFSTQCPD